MPSIYWFTIYARQVSRSNRVALVVPWCIYVWLIWIKHARSQQHDYSTMASAIFTTSEAIYSILNRRSVHSIYICNILLRDRWTAWRPNDTTHHGNINKPSKRQKHKQHATRNTQNEDLTTGCKSVFDILPSEAAKSNIPPELFHSTSQNCVERLQTQPTQRTISESDRTSYVEYVL